MKATHTITIKLTVKDVDPETYPHAVLRPEQAVADCLRQWVQEIDTASIERLRTYYGLELKRCSVPKAK